MKKRRLCVVTTSRADYGCLSGLMAAIAADPELELQVIAAAAHVSSAQGMTVTAIEADGFHVDCRIEMLLDADTPAAKAKSVGIGLLQFPDVLARLAPDILVLLGDRFELIAPATAALLLKIPIAHIHGGETSEGAVDEAVRHAVTKMASLHFVATEAYRRRVIAMGEAPERVFHVGAPALDALHRARPIDRESLAAELSFDLAGPVALVTFHPETLETVAPAEQAAELLAAIRASGLRAIFTSANADSGGAAVNALLAGFCAADPGRYRLFDHLGARRYTGCLAHVTLMIGNSSSGLIEAPSFGLPVVNVGGRQDGRLRAPNVIDVPCTAAAIGDGIRRALDPAFRAGLAGLVNPYDAHGDGRANQRITDVLKAYPLGTGLLRKRFHDVPGGSE